MPNFDRTGPNGDGPRSGRAMGKCGGKNRPGSSHEEDSTSHRGFGNGNRANGGRGKGMGRRRRFDP